MGTIRRLATTAALGAAAMYFYDPQRGKRRRALLRDKLTHLAKQSGTAYDAFAQDAANRVQGMLAELQSLTTPGDAPEAVIVARARSGLGRVNSHPGAISITAQDGTITLSGDILASEHDLTVARLASVRGVKHIVDHLKVYQHEGDIPALQGGMPRAAEIPIYRHDHWTPTGRVVASVAGGGMVLYGVLRGGLTGLLVGVPGALLCLRGVTDLPMRRLLGIGAGRQAVYHQKEIDVDAPVDEVYEFWRHYENFPHIFSHIDEVHETGPGRSHWVVSGPAGTQLGFDAVTTQLVPNELIAWESTPESELQNKGVVRFTEIRAGTRVNIRVWYTPPAGAIGDMLAGFLDTSLKDELDQAMVRFKSLLDLGKTTSHGKRVTREELERGQRQPPPIAQQQSGAAPRVH
jgi:uncharacterized membrane protein